MVVRFPQACLLLAFLVCQLPASAQVSQGNESETTSPSAGSTRPEKTPDLSRVGQLVVEDTNGFRREQGRGGLRVNAKLGRSAQAFAEYLAHTEKFSHVADGKQPWDRTAAQGYEACIVAENIAWEENSAGFTTRRLARAFVEGWEKSPPHRKNLLDPDLIEIGVGVARSTSGKYYAVQDFGRPKSDEITFSVANESSAEVRYSVDGKSFTIQPRYVVTHHRCRPPELTFLLPKGSAETSKREVFHPHNGLHYAIRTEDGRTTVTEE